MDGYQFLLDTHGKVEPVVQQQYLSYCQARGFPKAFEATPKLLLDFLLELHDQIVRQNVLHQFFNLCHLLKANLLVGSRANFNDFVLFVANEGPYVLKTLPYCLLKYRILASVLLIAGKEAHELIIGDAGQPRILPLFILKEGR